MARLLSTAARTAFYAPETDEVVLLLLTIEEESLAEPIRVVHNTENIVSRGETYVAFVFSIELPVESGDAPRPVRIQIDAVDQSIIKAIREAVGQPRVTMEVVLASDPDTVEAGPFSFRLESASYTAVSVVGEISFESVERVRSNNHKFTPYLFPDLF
ncbi:MAG: DUF1833 domain-containing protein [Phycisphaerales bacterium]|nr:DUF1833 domain-containing protein [Phycisphaerales bacterium]